MNDHVSREFASLHYISVDNVVQRILQSGPGTLLAKIDIRQAYRNVPAHPDDRHLLGMHWKGKLYVDKTLPIGLRSAPNSLWHWRMLWNGSWKPGEWTGVYIYTS